MRGLIVDHGDRLTAAPDGRTVTGDATPSSGFFDVIRGRIAATGTAALQGLLSGHIGY